MWFLARNLNGQVFFLVVDNKIKVLKWKIKPKAFALKEKYDIKRLHTQNETEWDWQGIKISAISIATIWIKRENILRMYEKVNIGSMKF